MAVAMFEITEVQVFPANEEKLRAYVTIVICGCFVIRDIKVIHGADGLLFVAMPSKRRKDGVFKDICHPTDQSTRAMIEKAVLDKFVQAILTQEQAGGVP